MTTIGAGQLAAAETTQSRGASLAEALAIFKAQVRDYKRLRSKSTRFRVGRAVALVPCLAILVLVLADWMNNLPPVVVLGVFMLLAFASIWLLIHSYYKSCAELYHNGYKASRRFRIEQDALIIADASGMTHSIPWTAIDNIVAHDGMLAIYYCSINSACLLKSAHENQDVESFCAELMRRWQAHRTPMGAVA
jgi:hypothetical protein